MKKEIKITTSILIVFCSGCIKDHKSFTQTKIINNTEHQITIKAFTAGNVDESMTTKLQANESKVVYEGSPWGKTLEPIWGTFLQPYDSIIVSFDNSTRKSKHLRFSDSSTICDYCIPFNNGRNLSNEANYVKTITKENSRYEEGYYTFIFTEQDYLDAKD